MSRTGGRQRVIWSHFSLLMPRFTTRHRHSCQTCFFGLHFIQLVDSLYPVCLSLSFVLFIFPFTFVFQTRQNILPSIMVLRSDSFSCCSILRSGCYVEEEKHVFSFVSSFLDLLRLVSTIALRVHTTVPSLQTDFGKDSIITAYHPSYLVPTQSRPLWREHNSSIQQDRFRHLSATHPPNCQHNHHYRIPSS